MTKITIKLNIDQDNNINITNTKTNEKIEIKYSDKKLNAKDVYNIFGYEKGNSYEIQSDIDVVQNKGIIDYYNTIIKLFDDIKNELNKINN